jgi:hypothetical protein
MICSIWWNGQRDSPGATAMWECLESQTYLERLFVAANSQTLGARQRRSYKGVIKNFMHVHYNEEPYGRLWQQTCMEPSYSGRVLGFKAPGKTYTKPECTRRIATARRS